MEEFERPGYWWLPTQSAVKEVPGTLSYAAEDGLVLRLMGSLEADARVFDSSQVHAPALILGITEDCKEWTLWRCGRTQMAISMPGYARETYRAQVGFRGIHIGDEGSMAFERANLGLSRIHEWAGRTVWREETDFAESGDGEARVSGLRIEYEEPEHVVLELPEHNATLEVAHAWGRSGDRLRSVNLTHDVSFAITLSEARTFDHIYKALIVPLQNFLTLATGRPNSITRLTLAGEACCTELQDDRSRVRPAEVFFSQSHIDRPEKALLEPWMLFSMRQVGTALGARLRAWLSLSADLATVCQLVFGNEYARFRPLDFTFLSLAQAVEAFHRDRIGGIDVPDADHQRRLGVVLAGVPAEYRAWAQEKLQYSNEVAFRRRVRELVDRVGETMDFVGAPKAFADRVTNTRNYLVHRTPELAERAVDGIGRHYLTEAMRVLLKASLLLEIGFTSAEVAGLFGDNQDFVQFRTRYTV